jgi:hypothetical protein
MKRYEQLAQYEAVPPWSALAPEVQSSVIEEEEEIWKHAAVSARTLSTAMFYGLVSLAIIGAVFVGLLLAAIV